jgi:hypothetical protein
MKDVHYTKTEFSGDKLIFLAFKDDRPRKKQDSKTTGEKTRKLIQYT